MRRLAAVLLVLFLVGAWRSVYAQQRSYDDVVDIDIANIALLVQFDECSNDRLTRVQFTDGIAQQSLIKELGREVVLTCHLQSAYCFILRPDKGREGLRIITMRCERSDRPVVFHQILALRIVNHEIRQIQIWKGVLQRLKYNKDSFKSEWANFPKCGRSIPTSEPAREYWHWDGQRLSECKWTEWRDWGLHKLWPH